jgi:peroxiredoxin
MAVKVGEKAPGFSLADTEKKMRSLAEFAGKNLVIAFYPGAFTGVCTKEMCTFRDTIARFNNLNAQVVGISVDAPFANAAFAKQNNLQFPLLSDYKHETIQMYGVSMLGLGGLEGYVSSKRAVFVVDRTGMVRYAWISDNTGVEPDYDAVAGSLQGLQ